MYDINKSLEHMGKRITNYQLVSDDFSNPFDEQLIEEVESKRNLQFALAVCSSRFATASEIKLSTETCL